MLRVRGFSANGARSGGIIVSQIVELRAGTVLFRVYHEPTRTTENGGPRRVNSGWSPVTSGAAGRPSTPDVPAAWAFHNALAVRQDWGANSPLHLGLFFAVQLGVALKAYHGEADHAPDASQTQVQKAGYILDDLGRQRRVRQVMLPKPWEYKASLPRVIGGLSSQFLPVAVSRYSGQRLPFE